MKFIQFLKYFLLLIFFSFWQEGMGQDVITIHSNNLSHIKEDNKIVKEVIHYDETLPEGRRQRYSIMPAIHFISKSSGDTCATFDLRENNPYETLNYPTLPTPRVYEHGLHFKTYDISNISPNRILQRFVPDALDNQRGNLCFTKMSSGASDMPLRESDDYTIVSYTLTIQLEIEKCFPDPYIEALFQTTLYVLNNKGEKIATIVSYGTNCITPFVAHDARYTGLAYGVQQHSHNDLHGGYKFYDLDTKETIVKESAFIDGIAHLNDNDSMVNLYIPYSSGAVIYTVYDFRNRKKYYRDLSRKEFTCLRAIYTHGISLFPNFQENPKDSIYYSFENDFEQEKF